MAKHSRIAPIPKDGDPVDGKEYEVLTSDYLGEGWSNATCIFYKAGCTMGMFRRRYRWIANNGDVVGHVESFRERV